MKAGEAGLSPVSPVAKPSQNASPECGSLKRLALCCSSASTQFALLLARVAHVRRGGICGPPPLPDVHHCVVLHLQRQGRPSIRPLKRSREALGLAEVTQEQCWSQKVQQCAICLSVAHAADAAALQDHAEQHCLKKQLGHLRLARAHGAFQGQPL